MKEEMLLMFMNIELKPDQVCKHILERQEKRIYVGSV
jgi:hypothetical protein